MESLVTIKRYLREFYNQFVPSGDSTPIDSPNKCITNLKFACCRFWEENNGFPKNSITFEDDTVRIKTQDTIELDLFNKLFHLASYSSDIDEFIEETIKQLDKVFIDIFLSFTTKILSVSLPEEYQNRNFKLKKIIDIDIFDKSLYRESEYKHTNLIDDILKYLKSDLKCLIISGNSSSGKTVALYQAAYEYSMFDKKILWFEMSNVNSNTYNIIYSIIKCINNYNKVTLIFDNAQAKPAEISNVLLPLKKLCEFFNIEYKIIFVCWPNAENLIKSIVTARINFVPKIYPCHPRNQIIDLVNAYQYEHFKKNILMDCKDDILVASSILEYIASHSEYPTREQLSQSIYNKCTKNLNLNLECEKCLYFISALGEFEIHINENFIKSISIEGANTLIQNGIIRLYHNEYNERYVYLGHRSMSNKVANYLFKKYRDESWIQSPEEIAVRYLRTNDQSQIHSMLERLDTEVQNSNNLFANLWKAFSNVRYYLYKKITNDCSWGKNIASMIFAAEALSEISEFDERARSLWEKQAIEIRKRWKPKDTADGIEYIGEDKCEVNGRTYNLSSEIVDFTENIYKTMEDEELKINYKPSQLANNTDYYRFHDNWLLGLLLGFEGAAIDNSELIIKYVECAQNMQLSSGAFYPERVSWVTARVIIGLVSCNYNYNNSTTVKRACDWLVSQYKSSIDSEGIDFDCGGWTSGTGTWNSDIQITLMNIVALEKAQYPLYTNTKISSTIEYIKLNATYLSQKLPNPLDIVWIVDVLALEKQNLVSLNGVINKLSSETINIWDDADKTSFEKQKESSDVSFMAKELLNIMWKIVNDNISSLLIGLEREEFKFSKGKQIFISYRRREGGGSFMAAHIYSVLNSVFKDDVFWDVEDLRLVITDFNEVLEKAILYSKIIVVLVTDNAFDRCIEKDYNINEDVFINEIQTAFKLNKHIIALFNGKAEVPSKLKTNPVCYDIARKLTKLNAIEFFGGDGAFERLDNDILEKVKKNLYN